MRKFFVRVELIGSQWINRAGVVASKLSIVLIALAGGAKIFFNNE
jgi:hypothetical protein